MDSQQWHDQHIVWKKNHDEIMKEMDFFLFAKNMRAHGWYEVELSRYMDNYHAIDIREWARDNCVGKYNSFGRHWLFERSQDAVMFRLRWS